MADLEDFLSAMELETLGDGSFLARNMDHGGPVVFGGQILAQGLAAAARTVPNKTVKSLHTIFARSASSDHPLQIQVQPIHTGRAFASLTISIRQGDRLCAQSLALLEAEEPDLIRHGSAMPAVGEPPETGPASAWWERQVVDQVDIADPAAVGPAELGVWIRFPQAAAEPALGQQLLGYASDAFLIGTALRPHTGFGQSQAHVQFSTTVLSHTLSFHEPFSAADWLLMAQEAPYAGRGRAFGQGQVFTADGRLVASFVQESMIRAFPEGSGAEGPSA